MKNLTAFTLAAGLGLALVSSAQAQNWAPDVDYSHSNQDHASVTTGRSAFVPAGTSKNAQIQNRKAAREQADELSQSGYSGN